MLKNSVFILFSFLALGTSPSSLAAELAPVEMAPVQAMPNYPPDKETIKQSPADARPINAYHVDFRYCLELKTNQEIAQCRYKKK